MDITLGKVLYHLSHGASDDNVMWLVDYSLRPIKGVEYDNLVKGRPIFKGRGQTYVEVVALDMGKAWTSVEGIDPEQTALYFVEELTELCRGEL